jgi:hypothetical protein
MMAHGGAMHMQPGGGGPGGQHFGAPMQMPQGMMQQQGGPPGQQQPHDLQPAFNVEDVEEKDGVRLSWNVW